MIPVCHYNCMSQCIPFIRSTMTDFSELCDLFCSMVCSWSVYLNRVWYSTQRCCCVIWEYIHSKWIFCQVQKKRGCKWNFVYCLQWKKEMCLSVTFSAAIYYVLSNELQDYMFWTLSGHLQAIKIHKITITIAAPCKNKVAVVILILCILVVWRGPLGGQNVAA